jgi:hypothetical protein
MATPAISCCLAEKRGKGRKGMEPEEQRVEPGEDHER